MRKKITFTLILFLILLNFSFAKERIILIDNFEDQNLTFNPEWFQFGEANFKVITNKPTSFWQDIEDNGLLFSIINKIKSLNQNKKSFTNVVKFNQKHTQNYALKIYGEGKNWYLGGIGTYLGIDTRPYRYLSLFIKGHGKNSGRLKIELFDDDANRWSIKGKKGYDIWSYEININWYGWLEIKIPFNKFTLENNGSGDGIWNPYQNKNSGGLIQIQLVALTSPKTKNQKINFKIDKITLKN